MAVNTPNGTAKSSVSPTMRTVVTSAGNSDWFCVVYVGENSEGVMYGTPLTSINPTI